MARKKKHEEHVNHERWLVSYADFITLLFATFTALYAISNADKDKFAKMAKSLRNAFATDIPTEVKTIGMKGRGLKENNRFHLIDLFPSQEKQGKRKGRKTPAAAKLAEEEPETEALPPLDQGNKGGVSAEPGDKEHKASGEEDAKQGEDSQTENGGDNEGAGNGLGSGGWMNEMAGEVVSFIDDNKLGQTIGYEVNQRGLVITLLEKNFFEPGTAFVRSESVNVLDRLIRFLRERSLLLRIEAHADSGPLNSKAFANPVELTSMRAANLANNLVEIYGYPVELLEVAALADWQPLYSNDTAQGRELNNRVELVVNRPPER